MTRGIEGAARYRLVAVAGLAGLAGFTFSGLGGPVQSLLAVVWLILLPLLTLGQHLPSDIDFRAHRLALYTNSIVVMTVGALVTFWVAGGLQHQPALRLSWPPAPGEMLVAAAALTAGGVIVAYAFRGLATRFGWRETAMVRAIMPDSGAEKGVFALLSVTAGVSEEIVFRGFLPAFLVPWTGSYLLAALPAAVAFGFLHTYQGFHGIVRTATIGLVLAAGVAWTGSLWPSIFAHTALDLLFGLVLARSLLGEPPADSATEGAKWT